MVIFQSRKAGFLNVSLIATIPSGKGHHTLILPVLKGYDPTAILKTIAESAPDLLETVKSDFEGKKEEVLPIYLGGDYPGKIILLGIGEVSSYRTFCVAFKTLSLKYHKLLGEQATLYLEHFRKDPDLPALLEGAITGIIHGTYSIGLYKSEKKPPRKTDLQIFAGDIENTYSLKAACQTAVNSATSQLRIFDLVNAPANHKTPALIARWAEDSAVTHGYQVTVFDEARIAKEKLDALVSVNRGSSNPARFIIAEYKAETTDDLPKIALIGKGVTFDTGGLSIKRSRNMHYMKSDMGGAAAVLGAVELMARERAHCHVMAFVPCTENSVDAQSTKPGDVISSYSGKTIEVIDTDAEGRLILADALSYAVRNYQPDFLIDLATLTGNVISALGSQAAGLFSTSDALAEIFEKAGERIGERTWRMPLWKEYGDEMTSDIADLRNLSDKPMAGSITAAKFLQNFTEDHPNWAHLDIAGMAFKANGVSKYYSATGYGIKLLVEVVAELSKPATNGS